MQVPEVFVYYGPLPTTKTLASIAGDDAVLVRRIYDVPIGTYPKCLCISPCTNTQFKWILAFIQGKEIHYCYESSHIGDVQCTAQKVILAFQEDPRIDLFNPVLKEILALVPPRNFRSC